VNNDPGRARIVARFGADADGVWVAGALLPGLTYAQVAEVRAASLSGEWDRDEHGRLLFQGAALVMHPGVPMGAGVEPHVFVDRPTGAADDDVARVRAENAALRAALADERDRRHALVAEVGEWADGTVLAGARVDAQTAMIAGTDYVVRLPAVQHALDAVATWFHEVREPELRVALACGLDDGLPIA
jgi:hypothetical protein